jgi:hypothetical protein
MTIGASPVEAALAAGKKLSLEIAGEATKFWEAFTKIGAGRGEGRSTM